MAEDSLTSVLSNKLVRNGVVIAAAYGLSRLAEQQRGGGAGGDQRTDILSLASAVLAAGAVSNLLTPVTSSQQPPNDAFRLRMLEELQIANDASAADKAKIDVQEQENKALRHELLLRESQLAKVRQRAMSGDDLDKPIRIYIDGCFDMMHYGHSNALRQAKKLGDQLVVGVMNDAEIVRQKGPPVMNEQERYKAVRACKWVDEVIEGAPYDVTPEWTNELLDKLNIDFIVHGDDPCITADGKDAYATAKDRGRFKMIKRTEGVSTTDIVGRMMLMSKEHHAKEDGLDGNELQEFGSVSSDFLATTSRYSKFCSGKVAKPADTVIYVAGAFDLFHAGHIDFLEKAKAKGNFLLVGVFDDSVVNSQRGGGAPILNMHERVLSCLSCRYVDEVIMGPPETMTADMMTTMNISMVLYCDVDDLQQDEADLNGRYKVAMDAGKFQRISLPKSKSLTTDMVIDRIFENKKAFETKVAGKKLKEQKYVQEQKEYVQEV